LRITLYFVNDFDTTFGSPYDTQKEALFISSLKSSMSSVVGQDDTMEVNDVHRGSIVVDVSSSKEISISLLRVAVLSGLVEFDYNTQRYVALLSLPTTTTMATSTTSSTSTSRTTSTSTIKDADKGTSKGQPDFLSRNPIVFVLIFARRLKLVTCSSLCLSYSSLQVGRKAAHT
jgi:hypothetical protein